MFYFRSQKKLIGIAATAALTTLVAVTGNSSLPGAFAQAEETEQVKLVAIADEYGQPSIAELDMTLEMLAEEAEAEYARKTEAPTDETLVDEASDDDETETDVESADSNGVSEELLATLIESEAGNVKSLEGRIAVGLTALKRVDSEKYPDTLPEVIDQPYQYADLVSSYSGKSHDAAVTAIALWEEGADDTVLPDGYMYFFGYNRQNWFYRIRSGGSIEIYALPGQTITDDVWQAFREIVLKEVPAEEAEKEVQEAIEAVEAITEQANDAVGETAGLSGENVAAEATTETVNNDAAEAVSTPTMDEVIEQITGNPSDV